MKQIVYASIWLLIFTTLCWDQTFDLNNKAPNITLENNATTAIILSCAPDGATNWSNSCDIPMGIMLGVF